MLKLSFDIFWTPTAKLHLEYWIKNNPKIVKKIRVLCQNISNTPTQGIGKPEHLKFLGDNIWSRRIDQEHRLVYRISEKKVFIIQARYHY